MDAYNDYMRSVALPMRQQLTEQGFQELQTAEEVDAHMAKPGVSLLVINSVCGCAAGLARPAVLDAVRALDRKPDHLVTVFAGQDREATEAVRAHFPDMPPSSPSIAIWKDGALAYFIAREQIEGFSKEAVEDHIRGALQQLIAE